MKAEPRLISLDLETTGLDERIHEAWEVAYVLEGGTTGVFQFPLRKRYKDMSQEALKINGFHDRYIADGGYARDQWGFPWRPEHVADRIAQALSGATLMGCNPDFDMRFLADLLRAYDIEPSWHHRSLDLGSYAAGAEGARLPLSSKAMAERVLNREAHTALGDARWNWDVYNYYRDREREW